MKEICIDSKTEGIRIKIFGVRLKATLLSIMNEAAYSYLAILDQNWCKINFARNLIQTGGAANLDQILCKINFAQNLIQNR